MLECLIAAIFFEARGEPIDGQYAVAEVIKNRVESSHYPDDYCSVVYQRKQFSFTHDGKSDNPLKYLKNDLEKKAYKIAKNVAKHVDRGDVMGVTSTHYHRKDIKPYWAKHLEKDGTIGNHTFYTAMVGK